MAYLRSGIDGGRQGSSLVRNRVMDIRGDLATGGRLVLSTTEPTVVDGNELGRIDFQAPLDTAGTDAILVAASIYAEADNTFSSSVNATELVFATGASETAAEKVRITSDGKVGIGISTPEDVLDVYNTAGGVSIRTFSTTAATGATLGLMRSNSGTVGTQTIVDDGDVLGVINFRGSDGNSFETGAAIKGIANESFVDGAEFGTYLSFHTTDIGTATLDERMIIAHDGKIGIGAITPGVGFTNLAGTGTNVHTNGFMWNGGTASKYVAQFRNGSDPGWGLSVKLGLAAPESTDHYLDFIDDDGVIQCGFTGTGEAGGGLGIQTAGTERLKIDAAGNVTTPYSTCSSWTCNANVANEVVSVQTQHTNIGLDQNTNGYYTCPITGSYMCMFTAMQTTGGSANLAATLEKNDSAVGAAAYALGGTYIRGTMFQVISCSANDTLHWELWNGYKDLHGGYSNITFYLIR